MGSFGHCKSRPGLKIQQIKQLKIRIHFGMNRRRKLCINDTYHILSCFFFTESRN